ncbi:MAG TPA: hypothetical protein VLX68_02110 [Chitinivibrionales bacterium]|nr:hypothetical protein [Chitinivibrionales bacterium]
MKLPAAFTVLVLAMLSCSPKYETMVVKEYQERKITNASLVIAPIASITVDYIGSVKDEFGEGNQEDLIKKHFKSALLQGLRENSLFSSVAFDNFSGQPATADRSFATTDAYGVNVNLPSDSATIRFTSSTPDVILFIQDLWIGKTSVQENGPGWGRDEDGTTTLAMNGEGYAAGSLAYREITSSTSGFQPPVFTPPPNNPPMFYYSPPKTPYLRYQCVFAYWDNRLHRVIAYGKIFAKSRLDSYGLGMVNIARMANWNDIDYQLVRALLGQTPFDKY